MYELKRKEHNGNVIVELNVGINNLLYVNFKKLEKDVRWNVVEHRLKKVTELGAIIQKENDNGWCYLFADKYGTLRLCIGKEEFNEYAPDIEEIVSILTGEEAKFVQPISGCL